MVERVYLDYNATAPLRSEARAAMVAALDLVGNPSSVHAEGRAAKMAIERAREQVAVGFGAEGADVIFTSGATEAAALACFGRQVACSEACHDALWVQRADDGARATHYAYPAAGSETGIIEQSGDHGLVEIVDAAQLFGKAPFAFNWSGAEMALISAHKIGGPKGIGALVVKKGVDVPALLKGGGQEMGRRSGTENVAAIVGFGAAASAAGANLDRGIWEAVRARRDLLEAAIEAASADTIFVGQAGKRLPNTSCFVTPGWKGETQVMSMDLAGFAISAGSACSSGKVKESRVLRAMGFSGEEARSAVRVSIGPETTDEQIERFADAWSNAHRKFRARAA